MSDVGERVKKIVVEHLGVEADKVVDSANFIDDLGADSLDTVELVMAFEEEFGVEIPDDQAETIVTVGDAVKYLEKASSQEVAAGRAHAVGGRLSSSTFLPLMQGPASSPALVALGPAGERRADAGPISVREWIHQGTDMERMRRVVVTGLGMVTPMACGVEATWRRLLAGESGARRVENFDVSDLPCQIAAQVPRGNAPDAFNPDDWMEPKEQRRVDDFIVYGMSAATQALRDANWASQDLRGGDRDRGPDRLGNRRTRRHLRRFGHLA